MRQRVLAFDSGIGGFGIVRSLRAALPPGTRIDYLADTALYPYGEQPDDLLVARIVDLIGDAIDRLLPDAIVVACNTASTLALEALRARYGLPVVGCVPPIRWAARLSQTRTIGLLATRATVRRPYLKTLTETYAPDCRLVAYGARGLADIAERAFRGQPINQTALTHEVAALFQQDGGAEIDVVGLGCTHYGVLIDALRAASPQGVTWLDPADAVARQTATVLADAAPGVPSHGAGQVFFTAPPPDAALLLPGLVALGYDAEVLDFARDAPGQRISARG